MPFPPDQCLLPVRRAPRREAVHSSDTPEKRLGSVSLSCTVFLFQRIPGSVYDTHAHVPFQKRARGVRGAPYTLSMKCCRSVQGAFFPVACGRKGKRSFRGASGEGLFTHRTNDACFRSVKGASKERKEKNRTLPDSCLLLTVWRIHCFLF